MIWVNAGNIRDKAKTLTYSRRCEALVNFLDLGRFSAFDPAGAPTDLLNFFIFVHCFQKFLLNFRPWALARRPDAIFMREF